MSALPAALWLMLLAFAAAGLAIVSIKLR